MKEKVYIDVLDPEFVEKQTMHLFQGDRIFLVIDLAETPINSRPEKLLVCVDKLEQLGMCSIYPIDEKQDTKYKAEIIKQYTSLNINQFNIVKNICFSISIPAIMDKKITDVLAITKMTRSTGIKNYEFSLTPGSYVVYYIPNKHEYSILLYDTGRQKIILL